MFIANYSCGEYVNENDGLAYYSILRRVKKDKKEIVMVDLMQ